MADAHDGLNLLRVSGKQNGQGQNPKVRKAVALVGMQLVGGRNDAALSDNVSKFLKNPGVHSHCRKEKDSTAAERGEAPNLVRDGTTGQTGNCNECPDGFPQCMTRFVKG